MGIKQFELFHGSVLTKLVRSDRPLTLRMIETHPDDAWAVYTINDQVDLFIKHCASPRGLSRQKGASVWQFVFSSEQVAQLRDLGAGREVYSALVCGRGNLKRGDMHICLLDPEQLAKLIDLDAAAAQPITVKYLPRKMLRVSAPSRDDLLVPQGAIDRWQVPGS